MTANEFKLPYPPIVEAILDIECDLPPGQQIAALEGPARECYGSRYPKVRTKLVQEHRFESKNGEPPRLSQERQDVWAFQFLTPDEKQLVQVRAQGYSFNRLAPYATLDDYLPEIEATWQSYVRLASPVQVKLLRLRYINRIMLPLSAGAVDLDDYLKLGPRLPEGEKLTLVGFLKQQSAVEVDTKHLVGIVLTGQPPERDRLPVIFDNWVASQDRYEPGDWAGILAKIEALRALKNRIFRKTLTEKCLTLFQQP
ncbi:MAG: hypothetical protein A3K19_29710 [Lentisphaerae bacterium RIFOXYB12_FULL_65_16]|nr:MAG: hypothetical protein A3K18_33320 [Lentisphaerae bacterium RIFOXYA12_64_32]OGV86505.1 MAG: hypothetical protein A3K19_29710 [Lentisphaerae bacterium RIFOXYB12_FULL_65_16]